MSEAGNASVTMAVDTKKYGIRIHKALFRQLGEPRYIQLLVNRLTSFFRRCQFCFGLNALVIGTVINEHRIKACQKSSGNLKR